MTTSTFGSLSEKQRALLQERIRAAGQAAAAPTIPRAVRPEHPPVSLIQQQIWLADQMVPGTPAYTIFEAVRIHGEGLCAEVLEECFDEIVRRHEVLRTRFEPVDGELTQIVTPPQRFRLPVDVLEDLSEAKREAVAWQIAQTEARRGFDLARDLMLRARLVRLSPSDHLLLVNMHHIAADGWSFSLLYKELSELYIDKTTGRKPSLAEPPIQYIDYAIWQRAQRSYEKHLEYWKRKLAGAPDILQLPSDHARPAQATFRGAQEWVLIPKETLEGLQALARQGQVTLFMILMGALQTLLHRYTGQTDIVVGSTLAARNSSETEQVIGPFIATLPFRSDLEGNPTFKSFLQQVRATTLDAYSHRDVPLELVASDLRSGQTLPHMPFFQVLLLFQSVPAHNFNVPGFTSKRVEIDNGTAKFDLTLSITETPDGLNTMFEYSTDLFKAETIQRITGHFQTLLQGIVDRPEARISELPILAEREQQTILVEWNKAEFSSPRDRTISELFEEQARRTPDRIALSAGGERLSFRELDQRANRMASYLRDCGVGPEVLVGVCLERSPQLVVVLLGILKAGGAYVPMDPDYPEERIRFMSEDARLQLVLTTPDVQPRLGALGIRAIAVDSISESAVAASPADAGHRTPNSLAYVIYTSGSTGTPKGVAVEHASVCAFLHWARQTFSDEELHGVLFSTSICFDLSVFEMFVPLSWGGTCIMVDNGVQIAEAALGEVTLVNTVPSVVTQWLRSNVSLPTVRTLNLAGEALSQELVERIYERWPNIERVNDLYGPTEDTVYSTVALRKPAARSTIGRPLPGKQVYLLDCYQQAVPIGVPGEMYIGGHGLASGYLHRPELTAERFVTSLPFAKRLYRTGDLARYRADGTIEFLGRVDHQVKIHGFRIELGEIETHLRRHPNVRDAVVSAVDGADGDKALVGYLVSKGNQTPEVTELRAYLKRHVPEYMIPTLFVFIGALPLTPNGKIDRKALPKPRGEQAATRAKVAPTTPTEERIAEIWREVLKLSEVGTTDNFFDVGGHSILAMQVIGRIRDTFECELGIRDFFANPTVGELAREIEARLLQEIQDLTEEEAEKQSATVLT